MSGHPTSIAFPDHKRALGTAYARLTGDRLGAKIEALLGPDVVRGAVVRDGHGHEAPHAKTAGRSARRSSSTVAASPVQTPCGSPTKSSSAWRSNWSSLTVSPRLS